MDKKRILLIDDEVAFTVLLKANLEAAGSYHVMVQNDSTQALMTARNFKPDLILLDVMMPKVSGGEIAQQLRDDPVLSRVPVVFLTAIVSREETDAQGRLIGGRDFLAKPIDNKDVIACIEKYLGA